MSKRGQKSKALDIRHFTPDINVPKVEITERQNMPDDKKLAVVEYLGNRTPCAVCGTVKLLDGLTQACIVTKTMEEAEDKDGKYIDRYMVCRMCGTTFKAREDMG